MGDSVIAKLISEEGDTLDVDVNVLSLSALLSSIVETSGVEEPIPISNIKTRTLKKVIEYLVLHDGKAPPEIEKPLRTSNFVEIVSEEDYKFLDVDNELLFELILAANFLNIKSLLDLTCGKVASMIKGKKVEEIRALFNIRNDFTPEEEAKVLVQS